LTAHTAASWLELNAGQRRALWSNHQQEQREMATNNRGGRRGGNRGRGGRSNNPEGKNQYSGMTSTARDNPIAAAAVVGGAVAAGVFLWSRRNQISDQIGNLADQISEWRDRIGSDADFDAGDSSGPGSRADLTQAEIAEEALTLKEIGKTA
jgi:hypothetical protein